LVRPIKRHLRRFESVDHMARQRSLADDDHYVLERLVHGIEALSEVEDVTVEMDESFADCDRPNAALLSLPPRLERAIRLRYGLCGAGGDGPMTFAEIGEVFGVTNRRAMQMVTKAQRKMFRYLHASGRVTPEEEHDLNKQRAIYEAEERVLRERQAHWQDARAAQQRAERERRAIETEQAMVAQCRRNAEELARSQERESGSLPVIEGPAPPDRRLVRSDNSVDGVFDDRQLPPWTVSVVNKISEMIDLRFPLLMLWVPAVAGLLLVLTSEAAVVFLVTFVVVIWLPWELTVFQRFGMAHHPV